jgi:hydroxymethylpyrimidine kinase/phosphomethylpyrimidine kinase/thiamine-phosphate diphosphorylase
MAPTNMKRPIVWTIAGSDSGGGAGIQADLHTFHALGVYGCSVITAVTAQNSVQVGEIYYLPRTSIMAQITQLAEDLPAKAIKLGMLGDVDATQAILEFLKTYIGAIVLDPVLVASCGDALFTENLATQCQYLRAIFPYVQLITPNLREAEILTGQSVLSYHDMQQAAQALLTLGARSVLIKGGHFTEDCLSQDYWTDGVASFWIASPRQPQGSYHGTGCTLASAIAAALALGYEMKSAITIGKMYVNQGIAHAQQYGAGPPPVAHQGWPQQPAYLPWVAQQPLPVREDKFPECGVSPLGFYPVVDEPAWLEKLLPLGVKTVQLRIKNKVGAALQQAIKTAVALANRYEARLFINDYWELAIQYGAYGVHLGQEDLDTADIERIHTANLRLGISTHSYYELARAHALHPSYVALGPIYPTTSKVMPFAPQGLAQLRRWRSLVDYPLVAIGGIDLPQLPAVLATGVDGVAVISAITGAADPASKATEFLQLYSTVTDFAKLRG